ncbi:hypothetical protein [Pseudothioclava arenosa]|uniref:Uncharacterized protein n=1 Tax=Pseudothioclava arenosa TaxID=1795308 RepID=A0A2A4CNQ8_9RHOB|nr:hypothetical protein [Pseudothioclava arenosa]PCD77633.1 hypothetical protein CLN94_03785 [Pseudothioclava arenosa]
MTVNQILDMVLRIVLRRGVNWGINKGIDLASGKGKSAAEMTPEERKQAQDAKATAQRARKMARITRRMF